MVSKILEKVVVRQVVRHVASVLPPFQSAYRPGHSTETAILKVLSDIQCAVDNGDVALLVLLDLSAAFDTVDHNILLRRLQATYGFDGVALRWFRSYLTGRSQSVRAGGSRSTKVAVSCGVPQGSVLGPVLFVLYTADLVELIERHGFRPHLYADDTQVYGSCRPADMAALSDSMSCCLDDVAGWMRSNRLQLNSSKTEVMWCSTSQRFRRGLATPSVRVGTVQVTPSSSVRDLGVFIDRDLSMKMFVHKVTSGCFAVLRQLCCIKRSVPVDAFKMLFGALVISRLDYCNSVLAGAPAALLSRHQSVLNAAARLTVGGSRFDHTSALLADLHWLRPTERIAFKLAVLAFKCQRCAAPAYLSAFVRRVADIPGRRQLRSTAGHGLEVRPSRLVTVGDRSFPVAAARTWNSLPIDVITANSVACFKRLLKTHLFSFSFPPHF